MHQDFKIILAYFELNPDRGFCYRICKERFVALESLFSSFFFKKILAGWKARGLLCGVFMQSQLTWRWPSCSHPRVAPEDQAVSWSCLSQAALCFPFGLLGVDLSAGPCDDQTGPKSVSSVCFARRPHWAPATKPQWWQKKQSWASTACTGGHPPVRYERLSKPLCSPSVGASTMAGA